MDDFEKYLQEVIKNSNKKEYAINSRFTSHHYWKGSGKVAELILESYRKFNKERADKLKALVDKWEDRILDSMSDSAIDAYRHCIEDLQAALAAMEDD